MGVDSTLVTALCKKILKNVQTFSLGFPEDKEMDESHHIQNLRDHLKVQNTFINFKETFLYDS